MKTAEIVAGKSYSNGKQVREVLELGEFKLYDSQSDTDCVRYRVTSKGRNGVNDESRMTRNSFARWAKYEVQPPGSLPKCEHGFTFAHTKGVTTPCPGPQ